MVEDDADIPKILAQALRLDGYRVAVASNGRETLDRHRAGHRPDLIVLRA